MIRQFLVSICIEDLEEEKQEDLEGEMNTAMSNHFDLDPDVGFNVTEVK